MKRQYKMVVLSMCCLSSSLYGGRTTDSFASALNSIKIFAQDLLNSVKEFAQDIMTSIEVNNAPLTKKEVITKEIPFSQSGRIALSNKAGFITITGWEKELISAEITTLASTEEDLKKIAVVIDSAEGKTSFATTYAEPSLKAEVQYVLKVPHKAVLDKILVGSGTISVEGTTGGVSAQTGSGAIKLTEVKGHLNAVTGSGDIVVRVGSGSADSLDLKTGSGSITIKQSEGSVSASTGSGSISLEQKRMTATTSIVMKTGSGSITLTIPQDAHGTIEGKIGLGTFTSDFSQVTESHKSIRGILGKGDASIQLYTGTGSIALKKG